MKLLALIALTLVSQIVSQIAFASGGKHPPGIQPVVDFKSERYLGKWYEIGSVPQSFQKNCVCTQAVYSSRTDGRIDVLNECRDKSPEGKVRAAHGVARFVQDPMVGQLEVKFFLWFWGDYWVTELGNDYDYSVVSNPAGDTLWVLSRTPSMDSTQLSGILERAGAKGIQVDKFIAADRSGCSQE